MFRAAFVCPMTWDALEGRGPGRRHCGSCRKVVYDLTDCDPARARALLDAGGGTICGRYLADRLGRPILGAAALLAAPLAHADGNVPTLPPLDPDATTTVDVDPVTTIDVDSIDLDPTLLDETMGVIVWSSADDNAMRAAEHLPEPEPPPE